MSRPFVLDVSIQKKIAIWSLERHTRPAKRFVAALKCCQPAAKLRVKEKSLRRTWFKLEGEALCSQNLFSKGNGKLDP